jgi:transcriptional regulator with XRE-family HTH domain
MAGSEFDRVSAGKRLKAARDAAGLTQYKLAGLVGVRDETVSRWEKGETSPSTDHYPALAKALGLPSFAPVWLGSSDRNRGGGGP